MPRILFLTDHVLITLLLSSHELYQCCHHAEWKDYEVVGEEVVVSDMHTRKKMMFEQVKLISQTRTGVIFKL